MVKIKNILLLVAEITKPGGTERVVVNLANSFVENGYTVTILSINTSSGASFYPLDERVHLQHGAVVLEKNVLKRVTKGYLKTINAIKNVLQCSASFVLATDPISCYSLALLKKKCPQHRFLACEHMGISIANKYSLLARKLLYRWVDAVVTLTQRDGQAILNLGLHPEKLAVIPNALSFDITEHADYSSRQILSVGKLDRQKGYDWLVATIAPVLKKHSDWQLVLVGKGEWLELLNTKIDALGLVGQIVIHPPTQNIREYYLNASIYVMSSRFEGFPMVLLEARACGLPVVSVDCPSGPAEILQEDDGFLVPMEDATCFCSALDTLITDIALRETMGLKAQIDAKRYGKDKIFSHWQTLFDKLS